MKEGIGKAVNLITVFIVKVTSQDDKFNIEFLDPLSRTRLHGEHCRTR